MCRAKTCSARALKALKALTLILIYRGLYSYRQRVRFSQTFFSYFFCMLSDFAKVFERKV